MLQLLLYKQWVVHASGVVGWCLCLTCAKAAGVGQPARPLSPPSPAAAVLSCPAASRVPPPTLTSTPSDCVGLRRGLSASSSAAECPVSAGWELPDI